MQTAVVLLRHIPLWCGREQFTSTSTPISSS
jgi:hypothetical protein